MKLNKKGFTLVELLIVIGLLGAIALIVIAAINPIEQANRARDTRLKADASQLISAIDRYFATQSEMPWATSTEAAPELDAVDAAAPAIGLCDTDDDSTNNATGLTVTMGDCDYEGNLIRNDELKTEFRNRDFITSETADKRIYLLKSSGSSSSVYACFIPFSNSEKTKVDNLRSLTIDSGTDAPTRDCTTDDWVASPCYICVPQ